MTDATLNTIFTANNRDFIEKSIQAKKEVRELANAIKKEYGVSTAEANSIAAASFRKTNSEMSRLEATTKRASSALNTFKGGLAAIGVSIGISAVTNKLRENFETIDRLNDRIRKFTASGNGLQVLDYAAQRSGLGESDIDSGLQKLQKSLSTGGDNVESSVRQLNLNFKELKSLRIDDAYLKIGESLAKITDPAQRASIAFSLFGKSGLDQVSLLINKLPELKKEFDQLKLGISKDDLDNLDELNDRIDRFNAKNSAGFNRFISDIGKLVNVGADANKALSDGRIGANITDRLLGANFAADLSSSKIGSTGNSIIPFYRAGGFDSMPSAFAARSGANNGYFQSGAQSGFNTAADATIIALNKLKESFNGAADRLSDSLGLTANGKQYINSILGDVSQISDESFNDELRSLRNDIASGNTSNVRNRINNLTGLAGNYQFNEDYNGLTGQSSYTTNSGQLAAIEQLKQDAGLVTKEQQKLIVQVVADKEGLITALASSPNANIIIQNVVKESAAKEAAATVSAGA